MSIALLATGDELTHGDVPNTTGPCMAEALSVAGFSMGMHVMCGDKQRELVEAISFLAGSHDVLIITGGLGPTSDDRTRFALSEYLDEPLVTHQEAWSHIKHRLAEHHLCMDEGNQAPQALFPEQASLFPNPNGTALGCAYKQGARLFMLLPGPPHECMPMFQTYAMPYLKKAYRTSEKVCLKWQLVGVPEGQTAEMLDEALKDMACQTGYRVNKPYLEFKVRCTAAWVARVRAVIDPLVEQNMVRD
jgi:nicotinamide-nucleotide amidase